MLSFTAERGMNGRPFTVIMFYQAPGAFVVMIILHLPFGRWSLEVIFQLNEDFSCGVGPHNFLVIALYTYKWGYEIDN